MKFIIFVICVEYVSNVRLNAKSLIKCRITLFTIKNNEKFCHQLVLIRGSIVCPTLQPPYPNDVGPSGRHVIVRKPDRTSRNWPVNSFHQFKALVRLNKGNNQIVLSYNYTKARTEVASLSVNLIYEENMSLEPLRLGIFVVKDSKLKFDMDIESLNNGEKNDYESAEKRLRMAALLWQALTSDNLHSFGLMRKSFRLELDSNGGLKVSV
jgi:hypothetical protein